MARSNRNLTDIFQDTANAIRGKTGLSEPISPRDFATEIDSIETGGGEDAKNLIERNSSEISNEDVTEIGPYAFYLATNLRKVSFPNCLSVGSNAFQGCSSLTSANFPNCSNIGTSVFFGCSSLQVAYFPSVSTFLYAPSLFYNCISLKSAYFLYSESYSMSRFGLTSTVFQNTPMADSSYLGYFGSIYVRASWLEYLKSASGWSYYSERLVGLTDEEIAQLDN